MCVCVASPSSGRFLIAVGVSFAAIALAMTPGVVYETEMLGELGQDLWLSDWVSDANGLTGPLEVLLQGGLATNTVGGVGAAITAIVNTRTDATGGTFDEATAQAVEEVQKLVKYSIGNGTAIMETYGWMP